jgi:predicted dehydrogenase
MCTRLNAAVIGAGYFARFHIDAWQRLDDVQLAGVVEIDQQRRETLKTQYPDTAVVSKLDDLPQAPDIVDIATPPTTHEQQIRTALQQTAALVICQKPFCGSLEAAQRLVEHVGMHHQRIVVHENFRFQPWYRTLKALLHEQIIGEVQQASFRLRPGDGQGPDAYLARQPYFQQMPRFLIHETGIHFVDVFRYLFGEPADISADLRRLNPHISGEDAGTFTFSYDNGLRVVFDGNRHLDHAAANTRKTMGEMLIEGTAGTLTLDGEGNIRHRPFGTVQPVEIAYDYNDTGFAGDCVYLLQAHIVDHLCNGMPLENKASDYLQNQRLEALIYESHERRCTLPVPPAIKRTPGITGATAQ